MNSNEDKLYIKIIAPDEIYNFIVESFKLKLFRSQNIVISAKNLKFEI
jgi:hypothetical protein